MLEQLLMDCRVMVHPLDHKIISQYMKKHHQLHDDISKKCTEYNVEKNELELNYKDISSRFDDYHAQIKPEPSDEDYCTSSAAWEHLKDKCNGNVKNQFKLEEDPFQSMEQEKIFHWPEDTLGLSKKIVFEEDLENDDYMSNQEKHKEYTENDDYMSNQEKHKEYTEGTHYDTLMQYGQYRCRRCHKLYENRLLLIIHETSHMRFARCLLTMCPICDKIILSDATLLEHLRKYHRNQIMVKYAFKDCIVCGLKYNNYARHERNYHNFTQKSEIVDQSKDLERLCHKSSDKERVVCEMCYLFCRSSTNRQYIFIKDVAFGDKQPCSRCGQRYTELKLVKTKYVVFVSEKKNRQPLSKMDKLALIRRRFKQLSN